MGSRAPTGYGMVRRHPDLVRRMALSMRALALRVRPTHLLIACLTGFALAFAITIGIFELVYIFSRSNENWHIDKILAVLTVIGLISLIFQTVRGRYLGERIRAREQAEATFQRAFHTMHHGLSMYDAELRLVICNRRYAELYSLPADLLKRGTPLKQILEYQRIRYADDKVTSVEYEGEILEALKNCKSRTKIHEFSEGRTICVTYEQTDDGGWVFTHEDITERLRLEARLNHLAYHDGLLTNLANRMLLRERLNQALSTMQPSGCLAVLCLDLDHFKQINDTLGHPAGDALLAQVADRLRGCVRDADLVARTGGDEFAILQYAGEPKTATVLAARIIDALSAPYEINGHHARTGTSIGIAIGPIDGADADQLLKSANLALHLAKSEARGSYRFFEPEMDRRMHRRRHLELDLRQAIGKGEFELHYQPLVDLATDSIGGFEALMRWNHPLQGRISPGDFIPLAEETGLIVPMGEWVLRQACADATAWPDSVSVSVNVSPVQFKSPNVIQTVFSALTNARLAPQRLELEITETVLLNNSEATLEILHQLRALGVRIAMDDFGVGYSSLSYFQSFPFDKIKLDRSFINGLNEGKTALAVLRAVASLGVNLGITTTAEGVETEEQLALIRREGISQIQGFLISPPRPLREIAAMLPSTPSVDAYKAWPRQRSGT